MRRKGLTLLELVVAVTIALIIGGTVAPILLQHLKDAKVAATAENLTNLKVAFESFYTKNGGVISDANSDGNYIDDMYNDGWLSKLPQDANFDYFIKKYTSGDKVAYYIEIDAKSGMEDAAKEILQRLDEKIDDGNATTGSFQYDDTNAKGFYLLYTELGNASWH